MFTNYVYYYSFSITFGDVNIMRIINIIFLLALMLFVSIGYADVVLDGTLGPQIELKNDMITVEDEWGKQVGSNLFHSFLSFSIREKQSVTFPGLNSIDNIIGRVTGKYRSNIDGTLSSPNANLYLLNPNGVFFGKNSSLEVNGSFHVSTADYILLGKNGRFSASHPDNSFLTIAPPEKFGFLNDNSALIKIEGGHITLSEKKELSVVAGNVLIKDGSLNAPSGKINILAENNIEIIDSNISVDNVENGNDNSGNIFIRTKHMVLKGINQNERGISSNTSGHGNGGDIDIITTEKLDIIKSGISMVSYNETNNETKGNAGNLTLKVGQMTLTNGSSINGSSYGVGNSGDIIVIADKGILIEEGSNIISGNIRISTPRMKIKGFESTIETSVSSSTGNVGNIRLDVHNLLTLDDHASINATNSGDGDGGNITIFGINTDIKLQNGSRISAGSTSNAGLIKITTDKLSLDKKSVISTYSLQAGGGNIEINSKENIYLFDSEITAEALGEKSKDKGGNIDITTSGNFVLNGNLFATANEGNGGDISIKAGHFIRSYNLSFDEMINAESDKSIDGEIEIDSPVQDVLSFIPITAKDFFVEETFASRCLSRGKNLRFLMTTRTVPPPTPYDLRK